VTEALAIGGGATTAVLSVAVILLVMKLGDLPGRLVAQGEARVAAESAQRQAENDRDAALARAAKAEAELVNSHKEIDAISKQRNDAEEKNAESEAATVASAPTAAEALHRLDAELQQDSTAVPAAAAGADHGHAGQDAVRPAGEAAARGPGGNAGPK